MPVVPITYQASDDKMYEMTNGMNIFAGGAMYLQYGAATSYTNSVAETSLYLGITTVPANGASSTTTGNFGINYPIDQSSLVIPAGALSPGTVFHIRQFGTIATTGTPTLRVRPGLVNTAGTFTAISDTGTPTIGAITGTCEFIAEYEVVCTAIGTSGQVGVRGTVTYGTNSTTLVTTALSIPYATTTIDTTQAWTIDLRATWGSASASNVLINKAGYIRIIG